MVEGSCDLCGKVGELVDAIVEGVVIPVCLKCSKYGDVVVINQSVVEKKIRMSKEDTESEFVDVVVNDYAGEIKKAREKKGLKQEDLAKSIAEKESVIHQLEASKLKPNFRLAKKLEVFLNIRLIDSVSTGIKQNKDINFKDNHLTIGDILSDKEE